MKEDKYLEPGSYSHGTMRSEDLIPEFMSMLESVDKDRAEKLIKEYSDVFDYLYENVPEEVDMALEENMGYLVDELFDILNDYCPPYCYFGAHEGDGADYGVWISYDSLKEDVANGEVMQVSDLSELDEVLTESGFIPSMVVLENDHGNVVLYSQTVELVRGEFGWKLEFDLNEIWSVV